MVRARFLALTFVIRLAVNPGYTQAILVTFGTPLELPIGQLWAQLARNIDTLYFSFQAPDGIHSTTYVFLNTLVIYQHVARQISVHRTRSP